MTSITDEMKKERSSTEGGVMDTTAKELNLVELNGLNQSLASLNSSNQHSIEPIPYQDKDQNASHETGRFRRRSSSGTNISRPRGYSNLFASNALLSLRRSLSGESGRSLSRYSTSYSVREIYGDLPEEDIMLRRSATKSTILTSLSHRVQMANEEASRPEYVDEEKKAGESVYEKEDLYQTVPDISVPTKDFGGEFSSIDPELVTWDGEDDPAYPRNWPIRDKCVQTFIVSIYTLIAPMSSSICSPAMNSIAISFGITSSFLKAFSVSVMVLAWALGPIVIAPLSESDRVGRRSILNISVWICFIFNLACGFAKNTAQLCVFRFLGGLGGCAALNVGAGTIADLWDSRLRMYAMAAYSISPTLGPVISPIISGFIVQNCKWNWVFFVLAILNFVVAFLGVIFFKETYSPRLLKIKAEALRKETGNTHLHTIFEIANGESTYDKIFVTVTRPLQLIISHPMVFGLGSYMAFIYGFMYLMIVTFPQVFEGNYGFSTGIAGLMFLPMGIGYIIGLVFWTYLIDRIYTSLTEKNNGVSKPEYRLPCLCFSGVGIPIGLVWYGWSAQHELHWIMPAIGSAIFSFSFIAVFQTIQNYLIDMNTRIAASSIASCSIYRSVFGFALPLAATPMYDKLNYGWGNTMCAFIALALGIPFPIFCLVYGERLRNWANRRIDKKQAQRDARNLQNLQTKNDKDIAKLDEPY